jgi:uncharacterized protein (TIGR02453 family)
LSETWSEGKGVFKICPLYCGGEKKSVKEVNDMNNALKYLAALEENNNREWYHTNKKQYQEANAEFERLIEKLIISIGKFDNSILHNIPKELTFKLVRDTRFSNDKSPYNPTFRAHISSAGKCLFLWGTTFQ